MKYPAKRVVFALFLLFTSSIVLQVIIPIMQIRSMMETQAEIDYLKKKYSNIHLDKLSESYSTLQMLTYYAAGLALFSGFLMYCSCEVNIIR